MEIDDFPSEIIEEIKNMSSSSETMNFDEEIKSLEEKRDMLMKEVTKVCTKPFWKTSQLPTQEIILF